MAQGYSGNWWDQGNNGDYGRDNGGYDRDYGDYGRDNDRDYNYGGWGSYYQPQPYYQQTSCDWYWSWWYGWQYWCWSPYWGWYVA